MKENCHICPTIAYLIDPELKVQWPSVYISEEDNPLILGKLLPVRAHFLAKQSIKCETDSHAIFFIKIALFFSKYKFARQRDEFPIEECKILVPPSLQPTNCGRFWKARMWEVIFMNFLGSVWNLGSNFQSENWIFVSTWWTDCIRLHLTAVLHGLWLLIMDQFNAQSNQVHQHQISN